MENSLCQLLQIRHPIILAPMAGGPSTPALVASVSNAGALGSLGCAYMTPEKIREEIIVTRELTARPFAVNLFVPWTAPAPDDKSVQEMLDYTNQIRQKIGLHFLHEIPKTVIPFEQQFQVVLEEAPAVFSFVFGAIDSAMVREAQKRKIKVVGTASSLDEALALEASGVDAICIQGFEGGGHRGVFAVNKDQELPLRKILEMSRGHIAVPVIAAGGLMNGADIREVMKLGASAAQLGTAFLLCQEAGTSACYREALAKPDGGRTDITVAFSGRRARGIVNSYMREFVAKRKEPLPFPMMNTLTQDIRKAATAKGLADYCSLWAGTEYSRIRKLSAGDLVDTLVREME